ncbi:hypothetical protein [Nostoc sp. DSM 114161]|uniref:hypothetical protein n=1 Tax=Nostoc sp. DSM 114161 TaxID=3440143 RepID=UPI004045220F
MKKAEVKGQKAEGKSYHLRQGEKELREIKNLNLLPAASCLLPLLLKCDRPSCKTFQQVAIACINCNGLV